MSLAGVLTGLAGVGCSACGTVVLSALLGLGTTGAVIRALPLGRLELPLAAVLLLTAALLSTARQAQRPGACWLKHGPHGNVPGTARDQGDPCALLHPGPAGDPPGEPDRGRSGP